MPEITRGYCQSTDTVLIPTIRKEKMDSAYYRKCLVSPNRPKKDQDQRHGGIFNKKITLQFVTYSHIQGLLTAG